MKSLKTLTNVLLVLAIACNVYMQIYSTSKSNTEVRAGFFIMLALVLSPFLVLLLMSYRMSETETTQRSRISLLIITTFTCSISTAAYYQVIFYPGSSTDALVFLVLPVYSFIFILIMYPLLMWLLRMLMKTRKGLRVGIGAVSGIALFYLLFSFTLESMDYKNTRNYQKRKMTFSIEEAKEKGVLVKELHYRIDSFDGSLDFHPYIERAFKYGEDTTSFVPFPSDYPYRLGFNKHFDGDEFVYIMDNELIKFDSSAGSGYNGASGYLKKPVLRDTITLGIRRRYDAGVGKIKVWN